MKEVEASAN